MESRRTLTKMAVFSLVLALCTMVVIPAARAQVTFTRDWAGKRNNLLPEYVNPPTLNNDCASNSKSTLTACHMLVNEIRQLVACEVRADNMELTPPLFNAHR